MCGIGGHRDKFFSHGTERNSTTSKKDMQPNFRSQGRIMENSQSLLGL